MQEREKRGRNYRRREQSGQHLGRKRCKLGERKIVVNFCTRKVNRVYREAKVKTVVNFCTRKVNRVY